MVQLLHEIEYDVAKSRIRLRYPFHLLFEYPNVISIIGREGNSDVYLKNDLDNGNDRFRDVVELYKS